MKLFDKATLCSALIAARGGLVFRAAFFLICTLSTLSMVGCPSTVDSETPTDSVVTILSLDDEFAPPVEGGTADTQNIDTSQYTGTVEWQKNGSPFSGEFDTSDAYTAIVTLRAKSGYTFTGVKANSFYYSGASSGYNAKDSGIVNLTFHAIRNTPMYHDAGFYKNVNRDGSGGETQDISELDGETPIDKAITWLSENALTNGRYTLSLDENIEQSTTDLDDTAFNKVEGVTLFITTPDVTTLTDGDVTDVRVELNASSYIFQVQGSTNKTLVLDGALYLIGGWNNSSPVVYVTAKNAALELNGNARIAGNRNDGSTSEKGSGVAVFNGGTFTMNGGVICENWCDNDNTGSVYVGEGGKFIMNGGKFFNNTSQCGGGVYVGEGGTFTMNGGEIYSNYNNINYGGGVYVNNGAFTMNGGAIYYNEATEGGAVYIGGESGTFIMNGGRIYSNYGKDCGAGVFVDAGGKFTMKGGRIYNNEVDSRNGRFGGGLYVKGAFTMQGGEIPYNIATEGGGVYVSEGTFTMNDGAIYGNTAFQSGGGVYVTDSGSAFTMQGGRIQGSRTSDGRTANTAEDGAAFYNAGGTAEFGSGGGYVGDVAKNAGDAIDTTDDTIRAPK